MRLYELADIINKRIPPAFQEAWDNCGFQINSGNREIKKALVALEISYDVIEEAVREKADLIITHHPLLFGGIKKVDMEDITGSYILDLVRAGIDVFSCHTSFDKAEGGNNDFLASLLGLENIRPVTVDDTPDIITRMGEIAPLTLKELVEMIAERISADVSSITYVGDEKSVITRVGICTGAGSEYIKASYENGCNVFITGDLRYHDAVTAREMGMNVIDAGHFGTEKILPDAFIDMINETGISDVEFIKATSERSPFKTV